MSKHLFDLIALRRLPAAVVAAAATLASGAALAVVGPAGTVAVDGALADIAYGSGGNVFELVPRLFVLGLGSTGNPLAVTTLNPLLQYAFSLSGEGTGLLSIDYSLQNVSAVQSFNDLRLMLYVNPDGDSASYQDVLHETWGAANAGDPVKREGRAFDPVNNILSGLALNNNLTEAPTALDAVCTSSPGCDATLGLQWTVAALAPGETWRVRVGLSDNGQHLSDRWLQATAVNSPDTVLTLSGVATVSVVPEPTMGALMLAGLVLLGWRARRRHGARPTG